MKRIISGVLLVVLGIFSVGFFIHEGWEFRHVETGSMHPTLEVGEIILTAPVEIGELEEGNIITFRDPDDGEIVTHTFIGYVEGSQSELRTKGDNNPQPDVHFTPLTYDHVEGQRVWQSVLPIARADFWYTDRRALLAIALTIVGLFGFWMVLTPNEDEDLEEADDSAASGSDLERSGIIVKNSDERQFDLLLPEERH